MPETTEPQLSESDVAALQARFVRSDHHDAAGFIPLAQFELDALIRDLRALRARLIACEGSRRVHELDNHHNALACGYCAGPIKDESARLTTENAALREQLREEQNRNQMQAETIMECEADITSLREQLAEARRGIGALKTPCRGELADMYNKGVADALSLISGEKAST